MAMQQIRRGRNQSQAPAAVQAFILLKIPATLLLCASFKIYLKYTFFELEKY